MVGFQQPKGFHRIRHYGLFTIADIPEAEVEAR
jgi:hypothetical protein